MSVHSSTLPAETISSTRAPSNALPLISKLIPGPTRPRIVPVMPMEKMSSRRLSMLSARKSRARWVEGTSGSAGASAPLTSRKARSTDALAELLDWPIMAPMPPRM